MPWASNPAFSFVDRPAVYEAAAQAAGLAVIERLDFGDLARAFFGWESCWMWHIGGTNPEHNGINQDAISKHQWQKYKLTAAKKRGASAGGAKAKKSKKKEVDVADY